MTSVPTREAPTRSQALPPPGRYRHFKGGEYELLEVARHSETEELLAIYCSLDDPATTWVRPLEMFSGVVESPEGCFPRFELTTPVDRCSRSPLRRLLLRVLDLADRRTASAVAMAVRSPLRRSDASVPRLREPL
ncbi:MAG: DUF1653 domain-containing protein [Solirubrobacteraceae bacterium]